EELLQFKLQQVWILVDFPYGKKAIGTKWVFRNKKYKRGIMIRNKEQLVALGHRQEEGIDYEEVFAHVTRIKAIRLFLAYSSYMGFLVYQMNVKSAFLYGTIEEEVYVTQPTGLKDLDHPNKVHKAVKALYGLHQAPRAWYDTLANYLLSNRFQRDVKSASTPVDLEKPLVKDRDANDVDVHLYRFMIGPLMYLIASRPILYLQLPVLGNRLISWQCKKQTVVATSTTEEEYVAASSCCGQVGDEAVHKKWGDRIKRAATTASSLEAEQDSDAQTMFEAASKQFNDPTLSVVLKELMDFYTKLSE
nr:copia protein [Tanacetum cinerariifolium]